MFRKTIFWTHLVCGVLTGVVVLTMSFTGVVLTYERQMLAWAERADYLPAEQQGERLPFEQLVDAAKTAGGGAEGSTLSVKNDPAAPVQFSGGRGSPTLSLNPYTGATMQVGSQGLDAFFNWMTGFHRWFNAEGENRAIARAITGASNLAFLFLILSGLYLWLPRVWKWVMFRGRLFFTPGGAPNAKARDFNWHHVFGIWSAIPLAVVVSTATVFSYPWASDLVYKAFGEEPPARGGPPRAATAGGSGGAQAPAGGQHAALLGRQAETLAPAYLSLDQLFRLATNEAGVWRSIGITLPRAADDVVSFAIDQGNGGQPQHRHTLRLDRQTGAVAAWEPFSSQSPGRQARSWVRFLHTGEALGLVGQTIAGLVSFTSLIMVWTGLALAWRRLVQPLFARR